MIDAPVSAVAATAPAKPYKGAESYQVEDAHLFFARDREANELTARILASRVTVLHAQSGAGKTSLLNARVIPQLETRGWTAVRVIPQNDPIASLQATLVARLFPPPEAEIMAVDRAWTALGMPDTVTELVARYRSLPLRDPRRGQLVAPVALTTEESVTETRPRPPATTWFGRLLSGTISFSRFAAHVAVIGAAATDGTPTVRILRDETIPGITEVLSELAPLHRLLLAGIEGSLPRDVWSFLRQMLTVYPVGGEHRGVALLFDQFEEMFTRFVDAGPTTVPRPADADWRLKWEFFEQLERAVGTSLPRLPVRYVISLRSEYLAQLDPIRSFVWNLDASSYHLTFLDREAATAAIQEPALRFGYCYSDGCAAEMLSDLTKEDRFVEPTHLQIVCERLWDAFGSVLAARPDADPDKPLLLTSAMLETLKGTRGILNAFFLDFVAGLTPADRLEVLEMLEPLVTASGTRNILERDDLVRAPFRDPDRREHLLTLLRDRKIVRIERRLGGSFVEITHEFLITPVLETLHAELIQNPDYSRFRAVLKTLEGLAATELDPASVGNLRPPELIMLHGHRARIAWNDWARELMLRSVVAGYHVMAPATAREILDVWLRELPLTGPDVGWTELRSLLDWRRRHLSRDELRVLNAGRDAWTFSPGDVEWILRSELATAGDLERDDVAYWAARMVST